MTWTSIITNFITNLHPLNPLNRKKTNSLFYHQLKTHKYSTYYYNKEKKIQKITLMPQNKMPYSYSINLKFTKNWH